MPARRIFLLLLGLTLLTRLPVFIYPILDEDESIHATIAAEITYGGDPYIQAVDNKTPLLWYQYALMFRFFGLNNMFAVHALTTLMVFGTAFFLQRAGRLLHSSYVGWIAAFAYVIFSTASFYKILASNFELHLLFFEALAIWLALRAFLKKTSLAQVAWMLLAGLAAAGSILTKQQGGMILVSLPLALWSLAGYQRGRIVGQSILFWLGAAAGLSAFALYARQAGFFDEMIYWTMKQAGGYIHSGFSDIAGWSRAARRIGLWILSSLPLWVAALFLLWRFCKHPPARFVMVLLALSLVPVSMGGRFFAHYFLLTLPGLCLGMGLVWEEWKPVLRRAALVFSAFAAILFLAGSLARPQIQKWEGYPDVDYQAIGARVRELTSAGDRIFVWGWSPEIYMFSDRRPASRFVFCDALSGRVPGSGDDPALAARYQEFINARAWDLLWDDFVEHPPRLIIDGASAGLHDYASFPLENYRLKDLVAQYYEAVDVAGVKGYKLKDLP